MSLNIDMKTIRPFWSWTLGLLGRAAMWWILGKYSTRSPSALRQLCPEFCVVVNLWTNSTFLPKQYLMLDSDSPFQDITQNLKMHKPLHEIDWWLLLHHQPKTNVSMKNHQLVVFTPQISSDCSTINFSDMSNICSKWDLDPFLYFWWNVKFLSLSHEHRRSQCWKHKHSPN